MDTIAIIVPVYNCESTIGNCIESILQQTFSDFKLYIIDDGSEDRTPSICLGYADKDSRVVYKRQENLGVSAARNTGMEVSNAEYIMFVDGDDLVESQLCQRLLDVMREQQEFQLAICGIKRIFFRNQRIKHVQYILPQCKNITDKSSYEAYFGYLYESTLLTSVYGKLYKSRVIRENKIAFKENLSFAEDVMFNLDYQKYVTKIGIVDEPLYMYNYASSKTSLTARACDSRCTMAITVYKAVRQFIYEKWGSKGNFYIDKVFYKDFMNYLEKMKWPMRLEKARYVLELPILEETIKNDHSCLADMVVFRMVFKMHSRVLLCSFAEVRKLAKRLTRGVV